MLGTFCRGQTGTVRDVRGACCCGGRTVRGCVVRLPPKTELGLLGWFGDTCGGADELFASALGVCGAGAFRGVAFPTVGVPGLAEDPNTERRGPVVGSDRVTVRLEEEFPKTDRFGVPPLTLPPVPALPPAGAGASLPDTFADDPAELRWVREPPPKTLRPWLLGAVVRGVTALPPLRLPPNALDELPAGTAVEPALERPCPKTEPPPREPVADAAVSSGRTRASCEPSLIKRSRRVPPAANTELVRMGKRAISERVRRATRSKPTPSLMIVLLFPTI